LDGVVEGLRKISGGSKINHGWAKPKLGGVENNKKRGEGF
jgi:hypothetical protein